jgi:hypothetical protein
VALPFHQILPALAGTPGDARKVVESTVREQGMGNAKNALTTVVKGYTNF